MIKTEQITKSFGSLQVLKGIDIEVAADEVVSIVLGEAGIDCRWKLEQGYPQRAYCTQYEESDYELICRLAAEYGLYFFYEHHVDRALRARADLDGVVSEATGEELAAASAATMDDVFGTETIVLDRQPLEGTDFAFMFGIGTEYEISSRFCLEFEWAWRYFMTEDEDIWPEPDDFWTNTHAWNLSLGLTWGFW